nr:PREDICTED: protein borderless isoform X1 [Bemisia tabaci]
MYTFLAVFLLVSLFQGYAFEASPVVLQSDGEEEKAIYLTASVGESVVLDCPLDFPHDVPIPYILHWNKEGQTIFTWYEGTMTTNDEFNQRINLAQTGPHGKGSINLTSIRETDSGWYECKIYFPNRTPSTKQNGTWYHLTVEGICVCPTGGDLLVIPPSNVTVLEGESAHFQCVTSDRDAQVNWYKDGVPLPSLDDLRNRVWISPEGSLTVQPTNMADQGLYQCEIIGSQGDAQRAGAYLSVQFKARILTTPREVYLPYGRAATLDCHYGANPEITNLRWEKDGFLFDPFNVQGVFFRRNGSLYFSKVDETHGGEYTCTPYNVLGTEGPSPPIHVIVQRPPVFIITPHNLYLRKTGESIEIPCDALDGNTALRPTIVWFKKNGSPLPEERAKVSGGNLTIVDIKEEDRGFYQCVASNEAATISSETELVIENSVPRAPYNLTADASLSSINVKWNPGFIKPRLEYSVWYRATDTPEWRTMKILSRGAAEATIPNLSPGREYELMILSQDQHGDGMFSKAIRVRTKGTGEIQHEKNSIGPATYHQLGTPHDLRVDIVVEGYQVSWSPPETGFETLRHYVLKWYTEPNQRLVGQAQAVNNYYIVKNLEEDKTYYFQVIAVSMSDQETASNKHTYRVPIYRRSNFFSNGLLIAVLCIILVLGALYYLKRVFFKKTSIMQEL